MIRAAVSNTTPCNAPRESEPVLIGGVQKQSLIDYPGRMSCVLFLTGCNFNCPYCHNPDLARGETAGRAVPDLDQFLDFLYQRRGFLDGVVISGGEPTLQSGLVGLCEYVRMLGYPIKLDTNGSRPGTLKRLIDRGLVDYIAMDVKTHPLLYRRHVRSNCDPAVFLESIRLIVDSGIDHEFRTTCVKPIVSPETIEAIARLIKGADQYVLQRFRNTGVLHPGFFQGPSQLYSNAELDRLKADAARHVACCLVR